MLSGCNVSIYSREEQRVEAFWTKGLMPYLNAHGWCRVVSFVSSEVSVHFYYGVKPLRGEAFQSGV